LAVVVDRVKSNKKISNQVLHFL